MSRSGLSHDVRVVSGSALNHIVPAVVSLSSDRVGRDRNTFGVNGWVIHSALDIIG